MGSRIHPTALIDSTAILGENVQVGPYSIIGAHVAIGAHTSIAPHVIIEDRTILGANCQVFSGAVIGGPPQDLGYGNEPTRVRIGDNTVIRECVTINRATGEGQETVIGERCFLMAYSHVAHNGRLGNHVILANMVQLAGYVELGDYAFIGGGCMIHQFVKVGRMVMMGGSSGCRQDLPPFSMNDGRPSSIQGINTIGLRRRGLSAAERQNLKKAFFYLWFSGLNQSQAIEAIRENLEADVYVQELIDFILASKRGISHQRGTAPTTMQEDSELEPVS